ncbi:MULTISPECIES: hypothetical protein [unclassified Sphingomonas]|uniref:hypothetical protein n=1 Tax=unclassified Sphingomonas TaxID=196159 RepID=UPI0022698B5F|nr:MULTISPECIES: hypothetical protein [unclassified Sphingomonas]
MTKSTPAPAVAAPTSVEIGVTPRDIADNLRIVDADTGKTIKRVIKADAEAGKVTRYDIDSDNNLVREGNAFKVVEEDRAHRIEWVKEPAAPEADEPEA